MPYLLDTNIPVRLANRHDPLHRAARQAVYALRSRGERLCYTSQILGEFWNVCTRPAAARGGLGLTISRTDRRVRVMEQHLILLPDSRQVHEEWRQLLVAHAIIGLQVYDARLVATMHVYGITHLLTFNVEHFRRFTEITVQHPTDIASAV
jgi:predicted nucleic acid-binding protein